MDTAEIQIIQKKRKLTLWTIICQWIWQPRRNGQLLRNIQPTETESKRNRSVEKADH